MPHSEIAKTLVKELRRPDGSPDLRPVHTIGIGATGFFEPSDVARTFCAAQHFTAPRSRIDVRFSNGSGSATPHDGWSDVRGMAVRFHLPDKTATDLIAMTLPEFFSPDPDSFLQFTMAAKPKPVKWVSPWKKIKSMLQLIPPMPDPYPCEKISPNAGAIEYANTNRDAQLAVFQAAAIGAPVSYVRAAYHAVHTFVVTGDDNVKRHVRFTWQPIAGVKNTNPKETPDDWYLQDELKKRIPNEAARFSLMMSIGESGDTFDDPTRPWPPHRVRVSMGTLTVDHVPEDQQAHSEKLSFNPMLLTEGIAPSDDPILHVRKDAYAFSSEERGGTPCPFSRSTAHGGS